ncbi:MAG: PAS domain-containing protein [Campylobacterota bacterium]|nr:PAS domain-containing protein [Campylobacterota bacterium]
MDKVVPIDEEYIYEGSAIVSQTNLDGVIVYTNKMFQQVSGYEADELIDQKYSIIKHPDMPKAVLDKITETINGGQVWKGLIKNLRKDGLFYWIDIEILAIKDDNGTITGFISTGKKPSDKEKKENIELYQKMLSTQG